MKAIKSKQYFFGMSKVYTSLMIIAAPIAFSVTVGTVMAMADYLSEHMHITVVAVLALIFSA